nr:11565_t:CDS:2 [Entrophospora candida]
MTALIKEQPTKDNTITYINNSNSYSLKQQQQSYHCKHHLSTKNDILTKKLRSNNNNKNNSETRHSKNKENIPLSNIYNDSVNNSNSNPPQRHQRQKEQEEQYQSRQFHSQEQQQRQYYHYGQETSKTDRYKEKRIPIMMHEKKINIKSSSSSQSTSLANNSFLMLNYNYYLLTSTPIYVSPFLMHVSIIAGVLMICWWSFWTFQIQGVLWKKELEEGVVVWSSDGRIMKANGIIRN